MPIEMTSGRGSLARRMGRLVAAEQAEQPEPEGAPKPGVKPKTGDQPATAAPAPAPVQPGGEPTTFEDDTDDEPATATPTDEPTTLAAMLAARRRTSRRPRKVETAEPGSLSERMRKLTRPADEKPGPDAKARRSRKGALSARVRQLVAAGDFS